MSSLADAAIKGQAALCISRVGEVRPDLTEEEVRMPQ